MEEITPEEAARRLAQLPPGALPALETNLRRITHGLPQLSEEDSEDLAEFYDEALQKGLEELKEPETVPLTIYLDDRKYIVGKATVIGRKVHAQIKPAEGRELEELVKSGNIESMSVHFSTGPPAQPKLPYGEVSLDGFKPTSPIRNLPKMEGLAYGHIIEDEEIDRINKFLHEERKMGGLKATHGVVDEVTHVDDDEFKDKFPYGPA